MSKLLITLNSDIYLLALHLLIAHIWGTIIIDREAEESLGDEVRRKLDFLKEKLWKLEIVDFAPREVFYNFKIFKLGRPEDV